MRKIVVVGGGGHAKVVISLLKKLGTFELSGYTDPIDNGDILGVKYLGKDQILVTDKSIDGTTCAAIGIGTTRISYLRKELRFFLESSGYELPALASPCSVINEEVVMGKGTVVMDGAVINSGSIIGDCAILNTNCTIEHDCRIGDYVHVAPGATLSGGVTIGSHALIGTGSTVIQGISICEGCLVGAGATVTNDLTSPGTYVGVPARRIRIDA